MPFTRAQHAREAAQVEAQIQKSLLTAVEGPEDVHGIGTQVLEEDTKNEILDNKQVVPNIKLVQPVADGQKNEEADPVTKINKSIDIYIDAQQIDIEKAAESSGDEWVLVDNNAKREASGQNNVDSKGFEHGPDGYDDHPLVITHTQKENKGIAKSARGNESEAAGKKGLSHGHADNETPYSLKEDETPEEDVEGGIAGMTTLPIRSNAKSGTPLPQSSPSRKRASKNTARRRKNNFSLFNPPVDPDEEKDFVPGGGKVVSEITKTWDLRVRTTCRTVKGRITKVKTQTKTVISRNVTKKVEADSRASGERATAIANQDLEGLKKALRVEHVDGKMILKLIPHKWVKGKNTKKAFTNEYNFKFNWTPFIKYPDITSHAYRDVYTLLKEDLAKQNVFLERNGVGAEVGGAPQGPMHVGDAVTVEALFKVIMSQATNNNNAIAAQTCLAEAFAVSINGKKVEPFYPDFHAIRKASLDDVKAALKPAGLQNMKATSIQLLLQAVHERNVQSKNPGWDTDANPPDASTFVPGSLSLEYLDGLSKEQIFDELVAFPLIGVKTACCILAFNYRMPVFAVDTHVFRISQWLGWIPEVCNRDDACAHLDKFIPDDIKFGLHQGFWHHGQRCKKCAGRMRPGSQPYDETVCVLEDLITRVVKERKAESKERKAESKERKAFANKRKAEIAATAGDVDDAEEPKEVVRNEPYRPTKPKKAKSDSSNETDNEPAQGKKMQAVIDDGFGAPGSNITGTRTFTWNLEVVKSTITAVEEIEKKE